MDTGKGWRNLLQGEREQCSEKRRDTAEDIVKDGEVREVVAAVLPSDQTRMKMLGSCDDF